MRWSRSTCPLDEGSLIVGCLVQAARPGAFQHDVVKAFGMVWLIGTGPAYAAQIAKVFQGIGFGRSWAPLLSRRIRVRTSQYCQRVFNYVRSHVFIVPMFFVHALPWSPSHLCSTWCARWWRCGSVPPHRRACCRRGQYVVIWQFVSRGCARHASVCHVESSSWSCIFAVYVLERWRQCWP